jgi:hypothetical protein
MFDQVDFAAFMELIKCVLNEFSDAAPDELAEILAGTFPWLENPLDATLSCLVEMGVLEPA